MKKFFTLVFATLMANSMIAQMHGTLNFAGASTAHVLTTNVKTASDTVKFEMTSTSTETLPFRRLQMIILLYPLSPLRM